MRTFYAWLLLIVSTCQWIGGHVCFEVKYFVQTERGMSGKEESIAATVREENGVDAAVRVLPEDEPLVPRGGSYGDFFAFSQEDSCGTTYFTIQYAARTVTYEQVAGRSQPSKDDADKTSLFKSLFSDFTVPESGFKEFSTENLSAANFQLIDFQYFFSPVVLSPPPDFA
ncbi:MAG: hypothetical protein HY842_16625 [Bacteroidetes bacterium]|nr:hypothetical protein [Bacteroidota bacterium]